MDDPEAVTRIGRQSVDAVVRKFRCWVWGRGQLDSHRKGGAGGGVHPGLTMKCTARCQTRLLHELAELPYRARSYLYERLHKRHIGHRLAPCMGTPPMRCSQVAAIAYAPEDMHSMTSPV